MRMQQLKRATQLFTRLLLGITIVLIPLLLLYLLADAQGASSESLRIFLLLLVWSGATLAAGSGIAMLANCVLAIGLRRPLRLLAALGWLVGGGFAAAIAIAAEVVRTFSGPVS